MDYFLNLIRIEADLISNEFRRARVEGKGTSQESADRKEMAFHNFLRKYFPFPFRIAKGNINDSYENRSNSIDCILLTPEHPYLTTNDKSYSLILADGVDLAIELKSDLSQKKEIERGLAQIRSVKKLTKRRTNFDSAFSLGEKWEEHRKKIPGLIYCEKAHDDIGRTMKHIIEYYIANQVPLIEQFDMIIIHQKGIIYNSGKHMFFSFQTQKEEKLIDGIFYSELLEDTLGTFLLHINKLPIYPYKYPEPLINIYLSLDRFLETFLISNPDLNKKLRDIGI